MEKTDLSKFNNDWYKNSELRGGIVKNILWYFCNQLFINSYFPLPMGIKVWLLRLFGASLGENITIKPKVNIKAPWNLSIGNHVWIGEKVWIDNLGKVSIGSHACLSQGALILSGNHDYKKSTFDLILKNIEIEEGVWIGAYAVVCGGVKCHSHSVLSVNSVASQDLMAYTIYQGNPCRAIRSRILTDR